MSYASPLPAAFTTPGRLLWTTVGIVEAPVDEVARLVFEDFEEAPTGGHLHRDEERRIVIVQGGWWYRGVTSIESHPDGARVTYRVYNIARTNRWMVPLVLLQYRLNGSLAAIRGGEFEGGLARIGERLGARVRRTE
ncbi:hypothetical protein [Actinopolymorpha alba]|uniref:hypothetical protein n=1 Tax=Actinopolymorpha alba TaxID=533267 RepID=UPI000361D834|nr:hypothetical protein [Actinopolymorpha alba]